jgi:hypothetical protein
MIKQLLLRIGWTNYSIVVNWITTQEYILVGEKAGNKTTCHIYAILYWYQLI